ncbi:hypothetical protein AXF42_Ash011217 [Apostasia shenzhenica]|uniref:Gem-associated protein 2 n=1 Tax=Apostasia shenzhenica TaxID=1088818 RepID=A0A2I0AL70_9ASPA|nr:hypothetical protein AXF42_Ash011217 [Apostasia shenzhenica]
MSSRNEWVDGAKRRIYSRSEMEAFRFVNVDRQRRAWMEVYDGLDAVVASEYNGLRIPHGQTKRIQWSLERKNASGKNDDSEAAGEVFFSNKTKNSGTYTSDADASFGEILVDYESCTKDKLYSENESVNEFEDVIDEDDDSEGEFDSIQRPAFVVEGDPDFESGPPLDGLEYLRRVRWEAAHIPKVKVAHLNLSELSGKQTPYMPHIPDIAECPPNLLPSEAWEDTFLIGFSKLREAFSVYEHSNNLSPQKLSECKHRPRGDPTLTSLLSIDVMSRASMLRNAIHSFETSSSLSRAECLWLYALCVTVDVPLDADTCASLRCLLRKCSSLVAAKSVLDDEVAMLSILIAIAGKYFGQSGNQ